MYSTTQTKRVCRICGESPATCGEGPDMCKPCANALLSGRSDNRAYQVDPSMHMSNAQYHGSGVDW